MQWQQNSVVNEKHFCASCERKRGKCDAACTGSHHEGGLDCTRGDEITFFTRITKFLLDRAEIQTGKNEYTRHSSRARVRHRVLA